MLRDISYIIAISIEIGTPIALAIIFRKKFKVSWAIFFIGLALFIVSLIRIPLNSYVSGMLRYYFMGTNLVLVSILFPSFTAALFEEGFRTLGVGLIIRNKIIRKRADVWRRARRRWRINDSCGLITSCKFYIIQIRT